MIFVTGPMFSGKREYLQKALGLYIETLLELDSVL